MKNSSRPFSVFSSVFSLSLYLCLSLVHHPLTTVLLFSDHCLLVRCPLYVALPFFAYYSSILQFFKAMWQYMLCTHLVLEKKSSDVYVNAALIKLVTNRKYKQRPIK